MMTRKLIGFIVLSVTLFYAGCAASPETENRRRAIDAEVDAILAQSLNDPSTGKPERCLSESEYRRFEVLDDRHLLFEGRRDRFWINTLRSHCPDLQYGNVLVVRSYGSITRICELDSFVADEWFSWPWYRRWPWHWGTWGTGMRCTLGDFQPVTATQVQAIKDVLRSR